MVYLFFLKKKTFECAVVLETFIVAISFRTGLHFDRRGQCFCMISDNMALIPSMCISPTHKIRRTILTGSLEYIKFYHNDLCWDLLSSGIANLTPLPFTAHPSYVKILMAEEFFICFSLAFG